jgi:lipoprotein-anchoring transpeptidase ErfK/SrfK
MLHHAGKSPLRRWLVLLVAMLAGFASIVSSEAQTSKRHRPALPAMGPSLRTLVTFQTNEAAGSIVIRKDEKALYLIEPFDRALRYRISVGREGFGWKGTARIGAKKEWPEWRPPKEMRQRQQELPEYVPAGPYNPLGARALYLHQSGRDTLYRIHGTNDPAGVGFDGTSGCFRLTNTDIVDLYRRVSIGAKVVVE